MKKVLCSGIGCLMKQVSTRLLPVFAMLWFLSGCGCDDGRNIDLVFINDSDRSITSVRLNYPSRSEATQHAVGTSLKRGESFGFEAGEYPVMMVVYGEPVKGYGEAVLGSIIFQNAPTEGDRWYVVARDGDNNSLTLSAGIEWPEGV